MLLALLSFTFFSLLEAFFSLSEISLVSVEKLLIEKRASTSSSARICLKLFNEPERLFTTTALGVTLSIAGNGIFTSYFLIQALGTWGVFLSSLVLPIFILFFGQIFPKSLGKKLSYPLVLYLAPPLYLVSYLFYPIYWVNQRFSQVLLKREKEGPPYFLTKFREVFLTMISYEEEIDSLEKKLMKNILDFGKKKVYQVMIPLPKIKALPISATVEEAFSFTQKYNFSYIPLYVDNPSQIKYIIKTQSLIEVVLKNKNSPLVNLAKTPLFIPENIPAPSALKLLQEKAQEIAIVVDEYGLVAGLITIEDLVEEVLGEFKDALDYSESDFQKISSNIFLVSGWIEIEKLNELGIPIPQGDYETLNGFLYSLLKCIPKEGEKIPFGNIEFQILKAKPEKIEKVLIRIKK